MNDVSTPQESDPPDVRLAVAVTIVLLDDLTAHLDLSTQDGFDRGELLLRIIALRSVLRRVKL